MDQKYNTSYNSAILQHIGQAKGSWGKHICHSLLNGFTLLHYSIHSIWSACVNCLCGQCEKRKKMGRSRCIMQCKKTEIRVDFHSGGVGQNGGLVVVVYTPGPPPLLFCLCAAMVKQNDDQYSFDSIRYFRVI